MAACYTNTLTILYVTSWVESWFWTLLIAPTLYNNFFNYNSPFKEVGERKRDEKLLQICTCAMYIVAIRTLGDIEIEYKWLYNR